MDRENSVAPKLNLHAFNCPNCRVYAQQIWNIMQGRRLINGGTLKYQNEDFRISLCESCGAPTIWHGAKMIYPLHSMADIAAEDMPEEIKTDYEEARLIAKFSPRGAAALLRLAIQKLCKHLGQSGKDINADIGLLVRDGLPVKVQQALDSVRVIGNEAVHPGTMDLRDDIDTVGKLFKLVNFIVLKTITEPKEIDAIYNGLPAAKLEGISKRS